MNIKIYILSFNDETEAAARQMYSRYTWAHILRIPTTRYLENVMYASVLKERHEEWQTCDFVGTISWKAHTKLDIGTLDALLARDLSHLDCAFFLYVTEAPSTAPAYAACHPHLMDVWTHAVARCGLPSDLPFRTGFCNYWMCRPALMERYIDWFPTAWDAISSSPYAMEDARWTGLDAAGCLAAFGVPHFPHHPFVMERLASLYFTSIGARLNAAAVTGSFPPQSW